MKIDFQNIRIRAYTHTRAALQRSRQSGVTLIEALVAGVIGLIVVGTIFYSVNIAGNGAQQLQAQQQLEQESSLVTETFTRTVRNGNFICAGSARSAPVSDTDHLASITVRAKDSSAVASFSISGDSLQVSSDSLQHAQRFLTSYLCRYRNPLSHFKVLQNGRAALCYLSMIQVIGNDTTFYTQTIGEVQCKN